MRCGLKPESGSTRYQSTLLMAAERPAQTLPKRWRVHLYEQLTIVLYDFYDFSRSMIWVE
jgi:hypothetical protein